MDCRDGTGRKNQDKLRQTKYRENIIKDFIVPRLIPLWNSLPRQVEWVEPAHYKIDRQNNWKYIARQNNFTGIWCLNSPCLSLASMLLFYHNQFSSALLFSPQEILKWNLETLLEIAKNDQLVFLTIKFITFLFHALKCHTDLLHWST